MHDTPPGLAVLGLPVPIEDIRRGCESCGLVELCLPAGIGHEDLLLLQASVRDRASLEPGESLFRQGDSYRALYVVRSGVLKTVIHDAAGGSQIIGFHLPGEIVGVDAMAYDAHQCSAIALERSSICQLSTTEIENVVSRIPSLMRQIVRAVSREVVLEQGHLVVMGRQQAQERVAIFLRGLSDRHARLSLDPHVLVLSMSRYDIANYLGLVVETVSRALTRMEAAGVLKVDRRQITILDAGRLGEMCGEVA